MDADRRTVALAVALSGLAGFVDALGFCHLGGLFVSFMSGNSTEIGVALGEMDLRKATVSASLVGLFVAGAMLGALVDRMAGRQWRRASVLAMEAILLALGAAAHGGRHDMGAVAAMVLAMGTANAVFERHGTVSIGLTYVTGALVKAGQGLIAAAFGEGPLVWVPPALQWAGLLAGAVLGALAYGRMGLDALGLAAGIAACAAAIVGADRSVEQVR